MMKSLIPYLTAIAALVVWPMFGQADMRSSDEAECMSDLTKATSKYLSCDLAARAKGVKSSFGAFAPETAILLETSTERAKFDAKLERCAYRFSEDWYRTIASYPGGTCTSEPFEQALASVRREAERVGQMIAPIESTYNVGCQDTDPEAGWSTYCGDDGDQELTGNVKFNICAWCTVTFDVHCYTPEGMSSKNELVMERWDGKYNSAISCLGLDQYTNDNGVYFHYTCTNWDITKSHPVETTGIMCTVCKQDGSDYPCGVW